MNTETMYRVNKHERGILDAIFEMAFFWLLIIFGYNDKPYYIQYKKHWWVPFWRDYKNEDGVKPWFKSSSEAYLYISKYLK